MDYKKKYKDALKRAKNLHKNAIDMGENIRAKQCEIIFPELKKNEDEKIKEDLIQWISEFPDMIWRGHYREDVIKWLERQGEQKQDVNVQISPSEYVNDMGGNGCYLKNTTQTSTWSKKEEKVDNQNFVKSVDDIKPKFKVGDWISNDVCDVHIASIEDGMYYFDEGDGLSIVFVDERYHIWTIEDAMDGDVLVDVYGNIGIFEKRYGINWHTYCYLENGGRFISEGGSHGSICYPATKSQRGALMKAMTDAGYTFDFDKKELKKIELSEWSEEDKCMLNNVIDTLKLLRQTTHSGYSINSMVNWLKSLRPHN